MGELYCPFCGYEADDDYGIMYHLESLHPEGDSPFMVKDDPQDSKEGSIVIHEEGLEFVDCLREGCGEAVLLTDLETHMLMHAIEDPDGEDIACPNPISNKRSRTVASDSEQIFDTRLPPALRNLNTDDVSQARSSSDRQAVAKTGWRDILNMSGSRRPVSESLESKKSGRRLGKSELGPHAHEKQMPFWLMQLLENDGKSRTINEPSRIGRPPKVRTIQNHISGIIPVVQRLLYQDPRTQYAYICHPCVQHVFKLQNEGGFCGYRNIQMMTSYIIGTKSQGFHHFNGEIPSIFQIQDFIERAWDLGINKQGRLETGGIRGTRKYIGTPEAQAMFLSLDITCGARGFKSEGGVYADLLLCQYVEDYYSAACTDPKAKVRSTTVGPLYFQHSGHSMTIVGFEKSQDGTMNLLVFDPMFHDPSNVVQLIGKEITPGSSASNLRAYRRSVKYLRKYNEFEILKLTSPNGAEQPLNQKLPG